MKGSPHASNRPPVPAVPDLETNDDAAHNGHDSTQPKSPLLTSHRLSNTSLDNVSLEEEGNAEKANTSTGKFSKSNAFRSS
jgi:hypothetical protein